MRQITLKKPVASVSSLGGSALVVFAATFACFMSAASLPAQGSTNVFNDAVFWFRGGKDKDLSGDGVGCMQQGEFFDDLNATNNSHANHQMSMQNYLKDTSSKAFKNNAAFVSEPVVFPALGNSAAKNMQVLRLSNKNVRNPRDNQYYYWPEVVNPYAVFKNIESEYTIISRLRLDDDGMTRTQCVFRIGHNPTGKQGLKVSFSELQKSTGTKYIIVDRTPSEGQDDMQFSFDGIQIPTNTWFDLAVVVGNNSLRIGVAIPEALSSTSTNPTIAFSETSMWTAKALPTSSAYYRLFCYTGQTTYQLQEDADLSCFIGSVQQLAIWGRALTDQEVMAAFGMPRPAIFRTGFDNGSSSEFGGTRSDATQTIDGFGSWQGIWNTMKAGDTWTVNFNALRDEEGLPQIFSIKSLRGSSAQIKVTLTNATHNTSLGENRVGSEGRTFWPVPENLITEGANTLIIRRIDGGGRDFLMDAMELGGSLGVGTISGSSTDDGRVDPECIKTGVPSAADPNTQHWPQELRPYSGITNLHFRVWVDPDVADKASFVFRTAVRCVAKSQTEPIPSGAYFSIDINGTQKSKCGAATSWQQPALNFLPGDFHGGWNDFEFIAPASTSLTCRWLFGYYRFETVLPSAFGYPPKPGLSVFIR